MGNRKLRISVFLDWLTKPKSVRIKVILLIPFNFKSIRNS